MKAADKKSIKADLATRIADALRADTAKNPDVPLVGTGAKITEIGTTTVGTHTFDVTVTHPNGETLELQVNVTQDL